MARTGQVRRGQWDEGVLVTWMDAPRNSVAKLRGKEPTDFFSKKPLLAVLEGLKGVEGQGFWECIGGRRFVGCFWFWSRGRLEKQQELVCLSRRRGPGRWLHLGQANRVPQLERGSRR